MKRNLIFVIYGLGGKIEVEKGQKIFDKPLNRKEKCSTRGDMQECGSPPPPRRNWSPKRGRGSTPVGFA